jgi:acetate kinase
LAIASITKEAAEMSKPVDRTPALLAVNGGSSSIRFALYRAGEPMLRMLEGKVDRIGLTGTRLTFRDCVGGKAGAYRMAVGDRSSSIAFLLGWLEKQPSFGAVACIGHRVVHGMARSEPARVTPRLVAELRRTAPFDPDHLPAEIELIRAFMKRHPRLPQVACFDTAFHRTMPRVARILPIPRRLEAKGVVRYGFHGLSYEYLVGELGRVAGARAARGRVILAHLGNGASMAAVWKGRSLDTSMGFTPAAGLVMSSRSGDLDPGIAGFLSRRESMTPARFQDMVNHESGLLGVSGTSPDMRDLLSRESRDGRAADAVGLFCYQARKWIGAYAAALGGLDTLVFAGGIGENAPSVRARICEGLGFLGVSLDGKRNRGNAALISTGAVAVRVIPTNEELIIARSAARLLGLGPRGSFKK